MQVLYRLSIISWTLTCSFASAEPDLCSQIRTSNQPFAVVSHMNFNGRDVVTESHIYRKGDELIIARISGNDIAVKSLYVKGRLAAQHIFRPSSSKKVDRTTYSYIPDGNGFGSDSGTYTMTTSDVDGVTIGEMHISKKRIGGRDVILSGCLLHVDEIETTSTGWLKTSGQTSNTSIRTTLSSIPALGVIVVGKTESTSNGLQQSNTQAAVELKLDFEKKGPNDTPDF